jgi:hypothetical protein
MADKVIPRKVWEALRDSGYGVRDSYSGRFMYGSKCCGFVCDHSKLVSLGVELHQLMGDEALDLARRAKTDNLGMYDMIIYFPGYLLEDFQEEDPSWCADNNCDQEECHRCYPSEVCSEHDKCLEASEEAE